jgi:hypothetical protein
MRIFFALAALVLSFAVGAAAGTTNALSDAEIQGRQLAQQLCDARPETNFNQTGILQIRDAKGSRTNIPVTFKTIPGSDSWQFICDAKGWIGEIAIIHKSNLPNTYLNYAESVLTLKPLADSEVNRAFANSDFSYTDLGLEFFHWPAQKVLKKEIKRSRGCTVLESTNPNPATNGYSRVASWIDGESGGIVQAQAYDANGKLLKEFAPKSFKKVNGQWELQEMEIRNVQTGSRTRLDFDLKAK